MESPLFLENHPHFPAVRSKTESHPSGLHIALPAPMRLAKIRGESSFGYHLRDLGSIPLEQLAGDAETRAGLVALRYSHAGTEAERLAPLEVVLAGLPDGTEYERQVLVYLLNVWEVSAPVLRAAAGCAKPGRGEQIMGEVVQELIDQGKVLGRAEGKVLGKADFLMELLKHRFGTLPESVHRRITDASPVQLDVWFAAALNGRSLAEMLGSPSAD